MILSILSNINLHINITVILTLFLLVQPCIFLLSPRRAQRAFRGSVGLSAALLLACSGPKICVLACIALETK